MTAYRKPPALLFVIVALAAAFVVLAWFYLGQQP